MKIISIITLLVKISNGEEVPKMVKYNDDILTYDEDTQDYYNEPECTYALLNDIHQKLNDEVEIVENKKINRVSLLDVKTDYKLKDILNEIIDKINGEKNDN